MMRLIYCGLGLSFVALGFVGAFLPLLPTTPFLILALMCFTKGSERLHSWLFNHRVLGKYLREWESDRVIPFRAKCTATVMIAFSSIFLACTSSLPTITITCIITGMWLVLGYIWHFPSSVRATAKVGVVTSAASRF